VEVGCGLGAAGLVYASSVVSSAAKDGASPSSSGGRGGRGRRRTITFLDREPYALHCVMASAAVNGLATGPIRQPAAGSAYANDGGDVPSITARAAIDDWTLPAAASDDENDGGDDEGGPPIKNICYRDLHLDAFPGCDNRNTVLLASDVLYEPSSVGALAKKLRGLLHPVRGGYALIADPRRERTPGCREAFVESVRCLGGEVATIHMPELEDAARLGARNGMTLLESDLDIDGSLCKSMLMVVHFKGTDASVK